MMAKESIVVVGTGWAGYTVSEYLDDKKFDITIVSPQDTLPYTPLLVCVKPFSCIHSANI